MRPRCQRCVSPGGPACDVLGSSDLCPRLTGVSKVDAMRALREARLSAAPAAPRPKAASTQAAPPKKVAAKPVAVTTDESCGHRSMNGRSCTRESGHAEKNHRYG
jgi:hypothetical protein